MAMLGFLVFQHHEFHHLGIDAPLVDNMADYDSREWRSSAVDYKVIDIRHLIISKMYIHESEDEVQIRFQYAYGQLFSPNDLLFDTRWEIRDLEGNEYEGKLSVYGHRMKLIDTVGVVLKMTREEYSELSGKELEITFYCTQGEDYESYAHGKLTVELP